MKYILLILGLAFILWEPLRAFFSKRSKREKWDQDKKLAVLLVCNWFFLLGLILVSLYIHHYNKNWWFAPVIYLSFIPSGLATLFSLLILEDIINELLP
jgi:hypothetical protein